MLRTEFSEKSLESYFYKSQKWTFINVQKSNLYKKVPELLSAGCH